VFSGDRRRPAEHRCRNQKAGDSTADCLAHSWKIKIFLPDVMIFESHRLTFETETYLPVGGQKTKGEWLPEILKQEFYL
jgi:hypothetical protein